jgi:hypothetical protein
VADVVGAIVLIGLVGILMAVGVLLKRMFGTGGSSSVSASAHSTRPYGALPDLGPVGALGDISPEADINDPGTSPDDLLGP